MARAENCNDNVIIVRRVTVIKNALLGFKNTDKIIAKNGKGSKNTDQEDGINTEHIAINKDLSDFCHRR